MGVSSQLTSIYINHDGSSKEIISEYANIDNISKQIYGKLYKWAKYEYTRQMDTTYKLGLDSIESSLNENYYSDSTNLTDAVTSSGIMYVGSSYTYNSVTETLSLTGTIKELTYYNSYFKFDGTRYDYSVNGIAGYYILLGGQKSIRLDRSMHDQMVPYGYDAVESVGFRLSGLYAGNDNTVECDRTLTTYGIFRWICTDITYKTSTDLKLYYIRDTSIHGQDIYKSGSSSNFNTYYNIV